MNIDTVTKLTFKELFNSLKQELSYTKYLGIGSARLRSSNTDPIPFTLNTNRLHR